MHNKVTIEERLERRMEGDPFWTDGQRRAFEIGCELNGQSPTERSAIAWKRQRGGAFRAWTALSRSRRKALVAGEAVAP